MGYTGAWKQSTIMEYTDQGVVIGVPNPAHAVMETHDVATPQGNFVNTPQPMDVGPIAEPDNLNEYPGMDFLYTDGSVGVDMTPISHDGPSVRKPFANDQDAMAATIAAHLIDYGGPAAQYVRPLPLIDEVDVTTRVETGQYAPTGADASMDGDVVAHFRGRNSYAVNNSGEGYRNGFDSEFHIERRTYVGERVHTSRPLAPNLVYVDNGIPAVSTDTSPYGHVFASQERFQSAEVPVTWVATTSGNFDEGMIQNVDDSYSPVVGWN